MHVTPQTQGDQRQPFYGSLDEIKSDIQATRDIGADELFIDPGLSGVTSVEEYLEVMEQMKDLIGESHRYSRVLQPTAAGVEKLAA